jgi:hypothetical protein
MDSSYTNIKIETHAEFLSIYAFFFIDIQTVDFVLSSQMFPSTLHLIKINKFSEEYITKIIYLFSQK